MRDRQGTLPWAVMAPIDPVTPGKPDPKPPAAPPFVDEDPNQKSVELGLEAAEAEIRDAAALEDDDAPARTKADPVIEQDQEPEDDQAPEIEALHPERPPRDAAGS